MAEMKAIRAEIKMFKEKRNAIQQQLREIINQAKGRRDEKGEKKSATAEYAKLDTMFNLLKRPLKPLQ